MAERVVHQLEAVEVQVHDGEALLGMALRARDGAVQLLDEIGAVGELREAVVVGVVVELGLGAAARRDVLRLHDEVMGAELPVARERDVEHHPHVGPVAMHAAQFRLHAPELPLHELRHRLLQRLQVLAVHELAQVGREELLGGAPQHFAERLVRLDEFSFRGHERHADRRVCERAVETALAFLELFAVRMQRLLVRLPIQEPRVSSLDHFLGSAGEQPVPVLL